MLNYKIKIIVLILVISTSCNSQKENTELNSFNYFKEKSHLEQGELNGKIKSISYFYSKNGSIKEKTLKVNYNKNGNRIKKFRYYQDANPTVTTWDYDKKGNNIKIKSTDNGYANIIIENNKKTIKEYKNSKLSLTEIEIRDKNRNIIESTITIDFGGSLGVRTTKRSYSYDKKNNQTSQKVYEDSILSYSYVYQYNKFNKVILSKSLNSERVLSYHKYSYDASNNLIKDELIEIPSIEEEKTEMKTYIYNKNNQKIEYRHYNRDFENCTKITYKYDNNLIEKKFFDKKNRLLEFHKFKYDNFNNEVLEEVQIIKNDTTETEKFTREYKYYK